jgi:hypothetical protein
MRKLLKMLGAMLFFGVILWALYFVFIAWPMKLHQEALEYNSKARAEYIKILFAVKDRKQELAEVGCVAKTWPVSEERGAITCEDSRTFFGETVYVPYFETLSSKQCAKYYNAKAGDLPVRCFDYFGFKKQL